MTQISAQNSITDRTLAYGSLTLPDFDNVLGEWWLGTGATGLTNRITGVNATVQNGAPRTNGYGSISFDGATKKGFITDVGAIGNSVTIVALVRVNAVQASNWLVFAGMNDSSRFTDYNLAATPTQVAAAKNGLAGSTDQGTITLPDATKFNMVMGTIVIDAGTLTPTRMYQTDSIDGTSFDDGGITTSDPASLTGFPLQMGAQQIGSYRGIIDIAAIALIDGVMGSAYLEEVYPLWKAAAEDLGLSVV